MYDQSRAFYTQERYDGARVRRQRTFTLCSSIQGGWTRPAVTRTSRWITIESHNSSRERKARCCNPGIPTSTIIDTTAPNIPMAIRKVAG